MTRPELIYSIFVSSTSEDLAPYRARARDIILTHNLRPLEMEYFPAESAGVKDVLARHLAAADGLVLIAGARYGSLADDRHSYVEWEFSQALAKGIPIICLIMSEAERARVPSIPDEERRRQEQFIQRLKQTSMIAEFDAHNFDRALAGALTLLPQHFRTGAGLIRAADYDEVVESTTYQRQNTERYEELLRQLSGIALIHERARQLRRSDRSMENGDERALFNKLLDLLYHDMSNQPVTIGTIESLMSRFIDRLHGFSRPSGFVPESVGELEASIDELFGKTLSRLRATSIHSNHQALATYKGYWEDRELGPFFKRKNRQFLTRKGDRKILRVFACDSLADSVADDWFRETVIEQVREGAAVKVVQIDFSNVSVYEDFGIYHHRSGNQDAGAYLLLAPRERNLQRRGLSTAVIADASVVAAYSRKFETLWQQSSEPLAIMDSAILDDADRQPLKIHEQGELRDLFGGQIILRRMERLDTGERLLSPSTGFVRKYQPAYAKALSDHIRQRFPDVKRLLYIGDTYKNDGTAIRNLQALGWDVSGFICEPKLQIARLWFNTTLYTNHWTDLAGFAHKIQANLGQSALALFDIDQTLWAPKGVHDSPLTSTRLRAMSRLIDEYFEQPDGDVARRVKARIGLLYREVSEVRYLNNLTLDNEDYKAAICVFLALNVVFDQQRLERSSPETGAAFFEELGRLGGQEFLDRMRGEYLPSFVRAERDGEANMTHFIMETLSTAQTLQYGLYAKTNGIRAARIEEHVRDLFRETVGASPVQYAAFRAKELEEALSSVGADGDFGSRLVLSKPAWDFAAWLKRRGVHLLGISDRPDESTVASTGESLLEAPMTIYGKSIADVLP